MSFLETPSPLYLSSPLISWRYHRCPASFESGTAPGRGRDSLVQAFQAPGDHRSNVAELFSSHAAARTSRSSQRGGNPHFSDRVDSGPAQLARSIPLEANSS